MKKKTLILLILLLVVINVVVGGKIYETLAADADKEDTIDFELLTSAVEAIKHNYVDSEIDTEELIKGALSGMLSDLDEYSQYLDEQAYEDLTTETSGKFGGLGIKITKLEGFVTIIAPIHSTPAERAGLQAGDKIVAVNGGVIKDPVLSEVVQKLRGEPGTKVTITILRSPDIIKDYTITRAIIKVPSVIDPHIIEEGIGYIKISHFIPNTIDELDQALQELATQGMDSLILDLRNNPGGLLISAVEVVDKFIPPGLTIVSTRGKARFQSKNFKSETTTPYMDIPMVVLIDGGSASSSEIVAGALRDLKRAILVGQESFGKGLVQTIIQLGPDTALRLTTAKYYTPSGVSIVDQKIQPDIEVKITPEERKEWQEQKDQAMEEALQGEKKDEQPPQDETGPAKIIKQMLKEDESKNGKQPLDKQLQRAVEILKALKIYKKGNIGFSPAAREVAEN